MAKIRETKVCNRRTLFRLGLRILRISFTRVGLESTEKQVYFSTNRITSWNGCGEVMRRQLVVLDQCI